MTEKYRRFNVFQNQPLTRHNGAEQYCSGVYRAFSWWTHHVLHTRNDEKENKI